MVAHVIGFHGSIPMLGFDHHNGLYYVNLFNGLSPGPPVPPAPIPPGMGIALESYHYVDVMSNGGVGGAMLKTDKSNSSVMANDRGAIISRNHECRSWHIPPGGNILVAVTMLFSSTKFGLGVGSVRAGNGPVASTVDAWEGHNLNCGDPVSSYLSNYTIAPGTVLVSPTPADYALAGAEWAASAAVELAVSWGYGKLANYVKPYVNRIPWPKWAVFGPSREPIDAAKKAAGDGVRRVIEGEGRDEAVQQVMEKEGREAAKAAREAIKGGSDAAFEAEKQAAIEAAEKEAERLIVEEGMPPREAAEEAARKAARDHFEKTVTQHPGRLEAGTEKAIQENADEAAQKASQAYKPGVGEPADSVPKETLPGAGVDAAGDKVKQEAGDATEAEQKNWVVEPVKEETGARD